MSTFSETEERQELRKQVAKLASKYGREYFAEKARSGEKTTDLWLELGRAGYLGINVPEEYGGGGGGIGDIAAVCEELAAQGCPMLLMVVSPAICGTVIAKYGTEEQKQQWLPKMATGEVVGAIAMTEPGTGSDLQNIKTKATREGDEYVITGSKTFITNGSQADLVLTVVKTDPEDRAAGISLMLVPTSNEGFARGRVLDKIGMKGQDTSELFFDGVRVPVSNLLGLTEGQGFVQLMQQLPQERLLVAVSNVAAMEFCLRETLAYVRDRSAFGRPIWGFQNTKFKMAEVATEARVARSFVDECIQMHLGDGLDIPTAAMVKLWCSERAQRVADACLQLHGGYGYMNEYPIARVWADMRVSQIYAGSSEIMKEIISRSL